MPIKAEKTALLSLIMVIILTGVTGLSCKKKEHQVQDGKPAAECPEFMLARILCYPEKDLQNIIRDYPYDPMKDYESRVVQPEDLDTPPALIPGSELFILTPDKIYKDKVKFISINSHTVFSEVYLEFSLYGSRRTAIEDYGSEIYIDVSHSNRHKSEPPRIIKTSENQDALRETGYLQTLLSDYSLPLGPAEKTNDIDEVREYYSVSLYTVLVPESESEIEILNLKYTFLPDSSYYDFTAVFVNGTISIAEHSKIIQIFTYNSDNYIAIKRWTPHTGDTSVNLYKIDKKEMQLVQADNSFAN